MAEPASPIRRQVHRAVLVGASALRDAGAGLRDGLQQLREDPALLDRRQALERELELARREGRWLSDDERQQLAVEQQQLTDLAQREQRRRRSLLLLALVSLLLPPFWPLALLLFAYLLFPRTTSRLTVLALVLTAVAVLLLFGLLIALCLSWL